jgi:hypothetical protein
MSNQFLYSSGFHPAIPELELIFFFFVINTCKDIFLVESLYFFSLEMTFLTENAKVKLQGHAAAICQIGQVRNDHPALCSRRYLAPNTSASLFYAKPRDKSERDLVCIKI